MAERVLTQAVVSFLLGILACGYHAAWGYMLCAAWLTCTGIFAYRKHRQECRQRRRQHLMWAFRVAACFICCLLGYLQYGRQQAEVRAVEEYLAGRTEISAVGTICRKEEKHQQVIYYLKDSYIICEAGCLSGGQILICQKADECSIGDTIQVKGACESFNRACNEGNFDERAYYYSKHILFRMESDSIKVMRRQKFLWKEGLYQLRKRIQETYGRHLAPEEAGVLSVMTLGEKGMLDAELKRLYQQSGISHVLAISGLHVSILGLGVYRFLRKRSLSYLCAGTAAGAIVLCFGQISGMELSTERAVIMFLVMLFGNLMGMAYDSVTALSLAALMQLWENPFCLWYAGFLFSYSAVLAVVVAVKVLQGCGRKGEEKEKKRRELARTGWKAIVKKGRRELWNTMLVSSCIQLVTLPLTVYFYYEFPVYSVLVNSLLLPFMGLLLLSGICGGLVGVCGGLVGVCGGLAGVCGGLVGVSGVLDKLAWFLLQPANLLLKWNEWVCSLFRKLPGAVWITGRPGLWLVIGYYAILAASLLAIHRLNQKDMEETAESRKAQEREEEKEKERKKKEKEKGERRRRVQKRLLLAATAAALVALLVFRPEKGLRVCFLDVGQGDGIYIQTEEGRAFFVDGGSSNVSKVGEYRILSFLKYQGVSGIDGWFVSHADADHISGLLEVWKSGYEIRRLFLSQWIVRDEACQELEQTAAEYGTEITYLRPGDAVVSDKLSFTCLFPWEEGTDRNETSLVLKLEHPYLTGIFAGDISKEQEKLIAERYPGISVDLYKASHHGSKESNGWEILESLRPSVSVISCGEKNSYGHPGAQAVARMEECGSNVFYTMKGGQITVGADERGIWVKGYK